MKQNKYYRRLCEDDEGEIIEKSKDGGTGRCKECGFNAQGFCEKYEMNCNLAKKGCISI